MKHKEWQLLAKLELRHLQMLVALDDTRSVSRVATALNISQPAVSKALQALETDLGVSLFVRTIRGVEPTAHGESLIRHAREILGDLDQAQGEMDDILQGRVTRLALGVLPAAALTVVPGFVARLEASSVAVSLSVQEGTMDTLLPRLRAGEVDLLVGNLPHRSLDADLDSQALYEDPLVGVVRSGHPLQQADRLDWRQIRQWPMLLPPPGTSTRRALDEWLLQEGLVIPRRHVESVSTLTNVGVLARTDAVGFMAQRVAEHFARLGLLHPLPLRLSNVGLHVGLVWLRRREREGALQKIRTMFQDVVTQMVAGPGTQPAQDPR
jgi:DNA-binding transcriptional LysR family regulator